MSKLKNQALILIFILVGMFSCHEEASNVSKPVTVQAGEASVIVENGRLKFQNKEHLIETFNKIRTFSEDEFKTWESTLKGFNSQRSNTEISDDETPTSYRPLSLKSILNKNGQYQVGNDIVYLDGEDQYIIKDKNEALLSKIIKKEIDPKKAPGVTSFKTKTLVFNPANADQNDNARVLLGNGEEYKYHFVYAPSGHKFRFRFVAVGFVDIYLINVEVRSYFEYYHSRRLARDTWDRAGETTIKTMNLNLQGSASFPSGSFNQNYTIQKNDNQNIVAGWSWPTDELWIAITGTMTGEAPFASEYYSQPVEWNIHVSKF